MSQSNRPTLSGKEFRIIREKLGLSLDDFAIELGYEGSEDGNRNTIKRFETGKRPISMSVGKLAYMFLLHGIPEWPQNLEAEPAREASEVSR